MSTWHRQHRNRASTAPRVCAIRHCKPRVSPGAATEGWPTWTIILWTLVDSTRSGFPMNIHIIHLHFLVASQCVGKIQRQVTTVVHSCMTLYTLTEQWFIHFYHLHSRCFWCYKLLCQSTHSILKSLVCKLSTNTFLLTKVPTYLPIYLSLLIYIYELYPRQVEVGLYAYRTRDIPPIKTI
jgi:hypothetical protein